MGWGAVEKTAHKEDPGHNNCSIGITALERRAATIPVSQDFSAAGKMCLSRLAVEVLADTPAPPTPRNRTIPHRFVDSFPTE